MQRLSLGFALALALTVGTSSVVAGDRTVNPSELNSQNIVAQAPETAGNQFVSVEHPTEGQANIVTVDGKQYLEFSDDFKSDRGPALRVILHQDPSVALNIEPNSYVSLGELQAFNGTQRYLVPDNVDLSNYQSVAIWCEEFNATFGYAPLTQ